VAVAAAPRAWFVIDAVAEMDLEAFLNGEQRATQRADQVLARTI
jgi:hypothetical protein